MTTSPLFALLAACSTAPSTSVPSAPTAMAATSSVDLDGDGFAAELDCDDGDARVFPGAREVCDSKDNDCDPSTSEEGAVSLDGVRVSSLTSALARARDGSTITLCSGTYDGPFEVERAVTIRGVLGPDVTILYEGVHARANLTLEGVTVTGGAEAGILVGGGPVEYVEFVDSVIAGNGCGIWANGKTVFLEDTVVRDNHTSDMPGGILAAHLAMVRSTVTENSAPSAGGVKVTESLAMDGESVISLNWAEDPWGEYPTPAGGVYLSSASAVLEEGALIYGNTAAYGGGVYMSGGIWTGGTIEGNEAWMSSGGGFQGSGTLVNVNVVDNYADWGGGISGGFDIVDSTVVGNQASYGGGIYLTGGDHSIRHTVVDENTASGGGGIYVDGSNYELDHVKVRDNVSRSEGGGLFIEEAAVIFRVSTVTGNTSATEGGGVYVDDESELQLVNSAVLQNTAIMSGGAIYLAGPGPVEATNSNLGVRAFDNAPDDVGAGGYSYTYPNGVSFTCTEAGCE